MKKSSIPLLIIVTLLSVVSVAAQSAEFTPLQLSQKGRVAFNKLLTACVFRVGGVGYAAQTSKEEFALYDLLEEREAIAALKSLVATASYEGSLYGLLGLSIRNHTDFNIAVDIYKARKERRERQATGRPFECFLADGDIVATQSGCLFGTESRYKVVTQIQSGHFDRLLSAKYRPK